MPTIVAPQRPCQALGRGVSHHGARLADTSDAKQALQPGLAVLRVVRHDVHESLRRPDGRLEEVLHDGVRVPSQTRDLARQRRRGRTPPPAAPAPRIDADQAAVRLVHSAARSRRSEAGAVFAGVQLSAGLGPEQLGEVGGEGLLRCHHEQS